MLASGVRSLCAACVTSSVLCRDSLRAFRAKRSSPAPPPTSDRTSNATRHPPMSQTGRVSATYGFSGGRRFATSCMRSSNPTTRPAPLRRQYSNSPCGPWSVAFQPSSGAFRASQGWRIVRNPEKRLRKSSSARVAVSRRGRTKPSWPVHSKVFRTSRSSEGDGSAARRRAVSSSSFCARATRRVPACAACACSSWCRRSTSRRTRCKPPSATSTAGRAIMSR